MIRRVLTNSRLKLQNVPKQQSISSCCECLNKNTILLTHFRADFVYHLICLQTKNIYHSEVIHNKAKYGVIMATKPERTEPKKERKRNKARKA